MAFGTRIAPLRRDDIPELSRFLIDGFGVPVSSYYFSHEVLAWKYFDGPSGPSGPSEDSASSLVARSAGRIVGHVGICPRQLVLPGNGAAPVSTMHAIDWLGSAAHPGLGAFLMLQALATSRTQYAIGGTAQAQAVFPRLGFEPKPRLAVFRKVLTPLHRLRASGNGLLGKWAGTAKDLASVCLAGASPAQGTVRLCTAPTFTEEIDRLQRQSSSREVTCRRDHSLLNYFLRYPLSGLSGWTIHAPSGMIGCALLKITPDRRIHLGNIVDCWLDTEDLSCWLAAVAALVDRLRALSADSITCFAANSCLRAALFGNGFAKSGERNVYIRDKEQSLPRDVPVGLSMLDGDHAIL
jgi:hypothetical protein